MFCKNFIRKISQIWCVINTKICCPASSDFCTNFFAPSACCSTFLIFGHPFLWTLLPHLLIFFSLAFSCFVFKPLLLVVMPQMITAQPLTQSLNFIFFQLNCPAFLPLCFLQTFFDLLSFLICSRLPLLYAVFSQLGNFFLCVCLFHRDFKFFLQFKTNIFFFTSKQNKTNKLFFHAN